MTEWDNRILIQVRGLKKWFPIRKGITLRITGYVKAVDGMNFDVFRGETLGLVGESGCGKSTLARTIIRLLEPTEGSILFDGQDLCAMSAKELRAVRRNMQIVFQDPFGSLHPRMKIGKIIEEPLIICGQSDKAARRARVEELIVRVGLKKEHLDRYPHEFSGGQRQRIVIARALATNPKLVICDEPVSALDVSVRSQILNLLEELQEQMGLTYLFISHDLSVVEHICDRVAVMYLGQMVEIADKNELYQNTLHPYTKALLSAIPTVHGSQRERLRLAGDIPSPANPPEGCRFHTRCPYAKDICKQTPEMQDVGKGHFVACHCWQELSTLK